MSTPTIIIGIGSSGLRILEYVQRFHYETFRKNKPDHVQYFYLETNADNKVGVTALPNEIKRVYLSLADMKLMARDIKNNGADWVPPLEDLLNAGLGAGGVRPFGRVGLWGRNNESNNFDNVLNSIQNAKQELNRKYPDTEPIVFVTGTLTGGTGSGIFIDIAYMVRDIMKVKELYGLFLLPSKPINIKENAQYYANAYAALSDLAGYNKKETKYIEKWPNAPHPKEFQEPPFELVQFISQDYSDGGAAISNLEGLFKMAGLYLFLNLIGIKEKRTERLVDNPISKYGTFGLSAIQYPREQLEEYMACRIGVDLVNRWINHNEYYAHNNKYPINEGIITKDSLNKWDIIVDEAFDSLNTIGGINSQDLVKELEAQAVKANSRDFTESRYDYVYNLFKSNSTNNYYVLVKNNIQVAVNSIINQIHKFTTNVLELTENITYTSIALKKLIDAINKCIGYWRSLGISEKEDQWNNTLRSFSEWMLNNRYKLLLEHDNILKERMINVFEMMKMHLLIPKLEEMIRSLEREEGLQMKSTDTENILPNLKSIGFLINKLSEVSGKLDTPGMSLMRRQELIKADLDDTTIPILRVYSSGSFEIEIQNIEETYKQKSDSTVPTINDITNEPLWEFLNKNEDDFQSHYFNKILQEYRVRLFTLDCIPNYDVGDYAINNISVGKSYSQRGLKGLLALNTFLTHEHYMPRFIAGSSDDVITKLITKLKHENLHDFSDDQNGKFELESLKNILIFYDEKLNFSPVEHLAYIEDMKMVYDTKPDGFDGTNDMWINYRNTYIPK